MSETRNAIQRFNDKYRHCFDKFIATMDSAYLVSLFYYMVDTLFFIVLILNKQNDIESHRKEAPEEYCIFFPTRMR